MPSVSVATQLAKLKEENATLKQQLRDAVASRDEIANDRDLFREHFSTRYKWWMDLIAESKMPSIIYLIQDDMMWFKKFRFWHML